MLNAVPAESFGGNGLLHVVNPVAILILRTDQDRAGRAHRRDAMAGDRAVDAQHEAIVAQDLKIVRGPIAREQAFVVQHGLALIGRHGEMAAKTIGRPRGMAGVAGHAAIGVRELRSIGRERRPRICRRCEWFSPSAIFRCSARCRE